jgi:diguanylate cyclase (GGDEF)-like protein/PAS domain S-box-containing protein
MTDLAEMMAAALDTRSDGIALLGIESEVVFWNRSAEAITGYASIELLSRPVSAPLESLLLDSELQGDLPPGTAPSPIRGAIVELRHKLGHMVPAIARRVILRDALGQSIGTAVVFHPAQQLDALPHGESGEIATEELQASRAELEDRLQMEFDDFSRGGPPFGVLWVSVDQAHELRKTHGDAACHAMLDKVRRALGQGLRPGEQMGRWGDDEFLVVAHERSAEMLAAHAQTLTGLARTADFRWWGDRISITVSTGAAQISVAPGVTLARLLARARDAMQASNQAGGNRATLAGEVFVCLPS